MTKRLQAVLRSLQRRVESAVYAALREGKSSEEINIIVVAILDESNFSNMFAADLQAEGQTAINAAIANGQEKYKWILSHTQQKTVAKSVDILSRQTASQIVRVENTIRERIGRQIVEGISSGRSSADIVSDVVAATGTYHAAAKTWENTARAGFTSTANIAVAKEAGVDKFVLVGASPEREFCKKHFGKSYPLATWKKLNNGQGLPVVPYCGGYNCVHTLEADIQ